MNPRPCPRPLHSALLFPLLLILLLGVLAPSRAQAPAGTAFTYHGVLTDSGVPALGSFDLRFTLYNAASGELAVGSPVVVPSVAVLSGAFACEIDFGAGAFDGSERWIEVAARRTGTAAYTTLSPRQKVTRLPYAGLSLLAGGLTGVLPIASGGTGSATKSFVDLTTDQTIEGAKTFTGTVMVNGTLQSSTAALELWAGGRRLYRLEDNAISPNLIGSNSSNMVNVGAYGATIAGGGSSHEFNRVTDHYGTVSGGAGNRAGGDSLTSGTYAAVGGGRYNHANGQYATVPGGEGNWASGQWSFAAGQRARAVHNGSFVWGDSKSVILESSADNEFSVRASGGYRFFSNTYQTTGVVMAPGGGSWASVSDRVLKRAFRPLDPEAILDRLAAIPVSEWSYTAQPESIRHVGPAAQDFRAAFGLGEDDRHITTIDADGVLMAAVQGLHRRLQVKDREIAGQRGEIETLRRENSGQNDRIDALRRENDTLRRLQEETNERLRRIEALLPGRQEGRPVLSAPSR